MPNRNKAKGNAFERKVCELLMEVYGGTWRRSPTSGALCGGKNSVRLEGVSMSQAMIDVGDIIPPLTYEGVVIECKSRKEFAFNLLMSKSTELESWIDQALIDYEKFKHSKVFLVIFKVNRKGMFIVTMQDEIYDEGHTGIDYYYDNYTDISKLLDFLKESISKNATHVKFSVFGYDSDNLEIQPINISDESDSDYNERIQKENADKLEREKDSYQKAKELYLNKRDQFEN